MSPIAIGLIGLVLCFVIIFLRMPIALAFAICGFFGMWVLRGSGAAFNIMGTIPYSTMTMYVWTVAPLFIFMGYMALHTGLAQEFYGGVRRWLGHFRGGLASTVILGNTAFGACTGEPVSAAVTFTAMSLSEMRKYEYADTLTLGSVAAGSTLAGLIPPSLGFILYGAITEVSIGKLFIAGIFPGLLLAGLYIIVIYFICRRNPAAGPPGPRTTFREKMGAGAGMWSIIVVFAVIIGGIYAGLFTPTEAAAAGAFTVLILGLARRKLTWQLFKATFAESGVVIGMIGFLLVGCLVFNSFLVASGVPQAIATFMGGITQSPTAILLVVVAIYLVLGMFIDALALILITVPIFFPVVVHTIGVDPVHFGVVVCISMMTAAVTPPFGIVVYAISGVVKDVPLFTIFRGALPFIAAMLICAVVVIFFPQIALFLPGTMMG